MSSEEKKIKVRKLRVVADELVIEPTRIVIRRPGKEKRREKDEMFWFEEE